MYACIHCNGHGHGHGIFICKKKKPLYHSQKVHTSAYIFPPKRWHTRHFSPRRRGRIPCDEWRKACMQVARDSKQSVQQRRRYETAVPDPEWSIWLGCLEIFDLWPGWIVLFVCVFMPYCLFVFVLMRYCFFDCVCVCIYAIWSVYLYSHILSHVHA